MTTPPEPAETTMPDQPGQEALRLFAEDIEKTFTAHGLTLTDDDTAATFRLTLQICARAIEGSQATGLLKADPKELAELLTVVRGMEQAPRLI
ncbi:hypothetical protein ACWGOK_36215 [Streptomyces eurythermus]